MDWKLKKGLLTGSAIMLKNSGDHRRLRKDENA
jgi:hypothetical protein